MPVFPSDAWVEEYCRRLEQHPQAAEAASVLEGVYRFVIDPAGPLADRHTYHLEIRPDGDAARVRPLENPGDGPRLAIAARYDRWRQLIEGRLDLGRAVLFRQLRISGELSALRRDLANARPLTEALRQVDTTWLEEHEGNHPFEP
jgi:hypothetical protein